MNASRDTLLDLIAAVNDHRRSLAASGLHARDPAERRRCQRLSQVQAVAVSRITRSLARHDRDGTPMPRREVEKYVDSLIAAYTGDGNDADERRRDNRAADDGHRCAARG
jgi:hypothetical protein